MVKADSTPSYCVATLTMPDGNSVDIPVMAKEFSSGRKGYFAQITPIIYDGNIFGGQIQIWNKSKE